MIKTQPGAAVPQIHSIEVPLLTLLVTPTFNYTPAKHDGQNKARDAVQFLL